MLDTYKLIFEGNSIPGAIRSELGGNSKLSSNNRFRSRIDGFVIEDSVNNITFPLSRPVLDTSKILLKEIYTRYINLYAGGSNIVLPWHYIVEFYGYDYTVHLTRPPSHIFPLGMSETQELMKSRGQEFLNDETKDFVKNHNNLDIREMIHILIIGDSSIDVYTEAIYKKIGRYIISPLARQNKVSPVSTIYPLNMGRKFNVSALRAASMLG